MYRQGIARQIRSAKGVEVFVLKYDGLEEKDGGEDPDERFEIERYDASTLILKTRLLISAEAKPLLELIAKQLESPHHCCR